MWNTRTFIGSTLAATVVALAGCDATMFANVNSSFTQFKTATKAAGSPVVPAAAMAATLGGVELAKTMAQKSASLIAAGGGNLIAAGAGNYTLKKVEVEKIPSANGVKDANYSYETGEFKDNKLRTTVTNFNCNSQGYLITAKGTFDYTAGAATKENAYIIFQTGAQGTFDAQFTGEITFNEKVVAKITALNFFGANPLPKTIAELANFTVESTATGDDYVLLEAKASMVEGELSAIGTSSTGKAKTKTEVKFNAKEFGAQATGKAAEKADEGASK